MKKLLSILLVAGALPLFSQENGFIKNSDSQIHYRSFGKGKPVLIINGGPGMNSDGFAVLAQKLAEHHRAIIYDQRGTGTSTVAVLDSSTITMDKMIGDIEDLRKGLGIKQWVVLGHSFGGMLGSYYATQHPGQIEKLILSSSGGIDLELLNSISGLTAKLSPAEKDSLAYWNAKISDGDTSHYAKLQRGKALAPAYLYNRKYIPIIAERLTQSNWQVNTLVWGDMNRIGFDCAEKLKTFNKPVLIIQGKQDIIDAKLAEKAHSVLKNSEVVLMDRCIHYGWLDRPDLYFSEIEKFIGTL